MILTIIVGILIVGSCIGIDQLTKALALANLADGSRVTVIPNFMYFELTFNNGAAFSILNGKFAVLMAITVVAVGIFIFMATKANFKKNFFYALGTYMMIGGMLGNFIDRAFAVETNLHPAHAVTDFISWVFFEGTSLEYHFAIFNMADVFLCVGVCAVILDIFILEPIRTKKEMVKEDE